MICLTVFQNHQIGYLMQKKINYTLGINFLHSDSSACIFKNGDLIAASEEERFTRIKHTSLFPRESIIFCLNEAKISLSDLNYVTVNTNPLSSFHKKLIYLFTNISSINIAISSLKNSNKKINLKKLISEIDNNNKFNGEIKYIDHHLSHVASSVCFSNFKNCVNISVDGFGDFSSCSWGLYQNNKIKLDRKIYFPHSLGIFYQSLTQFLGFKSYGDEYKLMGLSPYGNPIYKDKLFKLINLTNEGFKLNLNYFLHHRKKIFSLNKNGQFQYENIFSEKIYELLGDERKPNDPITQKHMDLAKSVQEVYEDTFFHLLNILEKKYKIEHLTLSGGCAMNSVANGKIINKTNFKKIYISPNPGDAGGSVGSAAYFLENDLKYKISVKNYEYLGKSYSNNEIEKIIRNMINDKKYQLKYLDFEDLYPLICNKLIDEKIIGWFQGRMEWGPRALGNRSILADPRNPNIKKIINSKIKRRESFRPFAPSIIEEHTKDWFDIDKEVPYMSEVYQVKESKRSKISGVVHVDGSGRLQSVNFKNNPIYYSLINEFYKITKVPIILNTSFNENEPIVNKPSEAIACFQRTNLDILVLGNWILSKESL